MAAEEDVPLRDAARHYEQKFGDKVRQVQKPGARPPTGPPAGGAGGRGAGVGVVILVIIVVRALISFGGSSGRHSTPPPTFTPPPQIDFGPLREEADERRDAARELAQELVAGRLPHLGPLAGFQQDDVPLPEGLCYHISREARQLGLSPGKRVEQILHRAARELLHFAARGERLDEAEAALRGGLNELLDEPDFYDERYFPGVALPAEARGVVALRDRGRVPLEARDVRLLNRLALEAAYPNQIVPLRERGRLDPAGRDRWKLRARRDLETARWADAVRR